MEKQKITEVFITSLKITAEDNWLKNWIKEKGSGVKTSPHYLYLMGEWKPMAEWMEFRNLSDKHVAGRLIRVMISLEISGQLEPIKIYKDGRINTGHKRAASLLYLGHTKLKAVVVPDDYKL